MLPLAKDGSVISVPFESNSRMRQFRFGSQFVLLVAMCFSIAWPSPPNIILITADDLGRQISCYGESRFSTPNLDRLAEQGIRFSNAYITQASCSSSRSSLLTGLYPHSNGQLGLAPQGFHILAGTPSLPSLLRQAGYFSGIIGKLHIEPANEFSFDWAPQESKPSVMLATRRVNWVAKETSTFIERARSEGKPFFLYLNFFDPHDPYGKEDGQVEGVPSPLTTEVDVEQPFNLYENSFPNLKETTATIINCIRRLDVGVGAVLDQISKSGLDDNTIVIFISDNGLPVKRGKGTCYEEGTHVPLIMRFPGESSARMVDQHLVSSIDVFATILDLASVTKPASCAGRSLIPICKSSESPWREYLFTEMNFHNPFFLLPTRCVRDKKYKLIHNLLPNSSRPEFELYDLDADPIELSNIAESPEHHQIRKQLTQALLQWQFETNDPLLDQAQAIRWQESSTEWSKTFKSIEKPEGPFIIPGPAFDQLFR